MKRSMFFCIGVCIFATILTSSCNTSDARPQPSVEPYVPPVTDVSPTNTPLPPLPHFDLLLSLGGGGGGGSCNCPDIDTYTGPSPAVRGGLSLTPMNGNILMFQSLPRFAYLCLWGFPTDEPFKISLISPDGSHSLNGDFSVLMVSGGWQELIWSNQEGEGTYVYNYENYPSAEVAFWWPGNLPGDIWKIEVTWQGGSITGDFDAGAKNLPEIHLEDTVGEEQFLPVCHPVEGQTDLFVIGESFPVNSLAYILLYERAPSFDETLEKHFKLVWKGGVLADDNGFFRFNLPYEFKSGVAYQLIAVTDSNVTISHQIETENISAVDCFNAPIVPSASSCSGAPPQRMVLEQFGYLCTQAEHFDIYESPGMSSSAIDLLTPSNSFLVIGGPQCADNQSWWQIETGWGTVGWVPETDDTGSYAICPRP